MTNSEIDASPFVRADGVTDDAPAIQYIIDAVEANTRAGVPGPKTIRLPAGRIVLGSPLAMGAEQYTALAGDPCGQTALVSRFGSGHMLAVAPQRVVGQSDYLPFGLDMGPSLVPGPGNSLRLGTGRNGVDLGTEPGLDLCVNWTTPLTELTVSYFFTRHAAAPEAGVHWHHGGEVAGTVFPGLGVWDYFGGLAVSWGWAYHHAPGVAQEVGKTYYVEFVFRSSRVTLYVGEPGQPAAAVLTFPTAAPGLPVQGLGLERFCLGYNGKGPDGHTERSHRCGELSLDGLRVSDVARHDHGAAFVCPAAKPTADARDRLVMNFERRGRFLFGVSGQRGPESNGVYVFPTPKDDAQGSGHQLRDLTFECHDGASGPLLYGAIGWTFGGLLFVVGAWQGVTFRGSTYGGRYEDVSILAASYGWCQTNQSMETVGTGRLVCGGSGVLWYLGGSVGGVYPFVVANPKPQTFRSLAVDGANEALIISGQIDDEGTSDPASAAAISVNNGTLIVERGQLVRWSPGVLVECSAGGVFDSRAWLHAAGGTLPLVRFRDRPASPPDIRPAKKTTSAPLTDHPEYLQFPPSSSAGT